MEADAEAGQPSGDECGEEHAEREPEGGADERGISVAQMHSNLQSKFTSAFQATGATIANVGAAFNDRGFASSLYDTDNKHPSETGCALAASVISATIKTMLA